MATNAGMDVVVGEHGHDAVCGVMPRQLDGSAHKLYPPKSLDSAFFIV